ncbi:hypothetical protein [Nocardia sp. NBC_01327]|uniref:hypothetical protein n=1 Tax=Nocardia sp. NBC_01327 TaxID=2903593 RepID=UPI002E128808|nr:hypothetical protein OG326_33220 [Nocardia sp. NBC_01327]
MSMSIHWQLEHFGWANVRVSDENIEATAVASYVTGAPQYLLRAVTDIVRGLPEARAEFEAEPTVYRWLFRRQGNEIDIRLLEVANYDLPDSSGIQLWRSRQNVWALAASVCICFRDVLRDYGFRGYLDQWGHPFPRTELEALISVTRQLAQPPADPEQHSH